MITIKERAQQAYLNGLDVGTTRVISIIEDLLCGELSAKLIAEKYGVNLRRIYQIKHKYTET